MKIQLKIVLLLAAVLVIQAEQSTPHQHQGTDHTSAIPKQTTKHAATGSDKTTAANTKHSSENGTTVVDTSKATGKDHSTGTPNHTGSNPTTIGVTGTAINSTHESTIQPTGTPASENATGTPTTQKPTSPPVTCNGSKILELPGHGWNNLNYTVTKPIFHFGYSTCKHSPDTKYVIPDELFAEVHDGKTHLHTEIFTTWNNYTNLTAPQLKKQSGLDQYKEMAGYFSADFQRIKKGMFEKDQAFAVRVVLEKPKYTIGLKMDKMELSQNFTDKLKAISEYLIDGHDEVAAYYADQLVAEYGTHYIQEIKVGGVLASEDLVRSTFRDVKNHPNEATDVIIAAQVVFADKFKYPAKMDQHKKTPELKKLVDSYVEAIKGKTEYLLPGREHTTDVKKLTFDQWEKNVDQHPEHTIDRKGQLLDTLIVPVNLPQIPPPLLTRVKNAIHNAIIRYHQLNSHAGCTSPSAPNFAFSANLNDTTCNVTDTAKFAFGGVFQTCEESTGEHDFCKDLIKRNPVTNSFSCPKHFTAVHLRNIDIDKYPNYNDVVVHYETFWCAMDPDVKDVKGVAFGGTFTDHIPNVNTGAHSCPDNFVAVQIDRVLTVCVGKDEHQESEMPFGGFFSCRYDNPYPYHPWPGCSYGYSKKIAKTENCYVGYCTIVKDQGDLKFYPLLNLTAEYKPTVDDNTTHALVIKDDITGYAYFRNGVNDTWKEARTMEDYETYKIDGLLPPPKNETNGNRHALVVKDDGTGYVYFRTSENGTWTEARTMEDFEKFKIEGLLPQKQAGDKKDAGGMSGGTIAAIAVVAVVAVVVAGALGGYYYKKQKGMNRSESRTDLHSNEAQPAESDVRGSSGSHSSQTAQQGV